MALLTCHECGHKVSSAAAACPGCGAKVRTVANRGKSVLRWIGYSICGLILSIVFVSCYQTTRTMTSDRPTVGRTSAKAPPTTPNPNIAACTSGLESTLAKASEAMRANDPSAAFALLHDCRLHTQDPRVAELRKTALIASNKQASAKADKHARELRAAKKKEGVSIGMSPQDVLDSMWGKPKRINRTTRANGTSEQWVYDGGYLYFDNDVLTSIQN